MDYEHDDRRAADVPGANGAEGSGLPAGREPRDADLPSSRSPEVRAFDLHHGSGQGPSELTESGQADDLFDAMFLTGGFHPPAFAAVDHDLGFPPPQAPDLASAFLAALDAIDDRRFVTPVPDEPPAAPVAPAQTAAPVAAGATGEPAYELRPQSRLELESERTSDPVDETPAEPVDAESAERLPWDTGRVPVAGLLTSGEIAGEREAASASAPAPEPASETPETHATESAGETWAFASYLESESDLRARAAMRTLEEAVEGANTAEGVEEFATTATTASVEDAEDTEDAAPIEEAAYFGAGLDADAGADDDAEAAAIAAAEAEAEAEAVAAAVAAAAEADEADVAPEAAAVAVAQQAVADADAAEEAAAVAAAAAEAEAVAEAEVLAALALAEAEQAELEAAIAAEAALDDEASSGTSAAPYAASAGFGGETFDEISGESSDEISDETSDEESEVESVGAFAATLDASLGDDAFDLAFDTAALDTTPDTTPDATPDAVASSAALDAGLTPGDDDFELEPSIGMEPMDAAPMAFDGPDAFAPAAAAEPEPEPEPESDELEDLQDFVVFSLGDLRCVVPIRNVVEVGRIPDAAPVPNAPAWLYGLGNLRGQVLSLIDLRAFFGVGRIKAAAGRMVVLRGDSDDITAGVMVDQVHQIVALSPSRFKEAPAGLPLPDKSTEFVWGACDYGNYTMIGLDVDGVLGVENLTEEAV